MISTTINISTLDAGLTNDDKDDQELRNAQSALEKKIYTETGADCQVTPSEIYCELQYVAPICDWLERNQIGHYPQLSDDQIARILNNK